MKILGLLICKQNIISEPDNHIDFTNHVVNFAHLLPNFAPEVGQHADAIAIVE